MERNIGIDYLKASAIIFVIITHNTIDMITRRMLLFPFWISMAVPIFMIVSGINLSSSLEKTKISSIPAWFNGKLFLRRLSRVLIPFTFVYTFEVTWRILRRSVDYNILSLIRDYLYGGYGSGSYYIPILLQLMFIFPICFFLTKRAPKAGGVVIVLFQLVFELLIQHYNVSEPIYRLLVFRYLVFVLAGIYFYLYRSNNKVITKPLLIISFTLGFAYLLSIGYLGYKTTLITYWVTTAMPSVLYIAPIVYGVMSVLSEPRKLQIGFVDNCIAGVSKASFHIFLVQKVYYYLQIDEYFRLRYAVFVGLFVCVLAGIIFFRLDSFFMNKINMKLAVSKDLSR